MSGDPRAWLSLGVALIVTSLIGCQQSQAHTQPGPPAEAATDCGSAGQADCPTQHWMKATLQAHLRNKDYKRLEAALHELAARQPAGYDGWSSLAEQAADAARSGQHQAVRQACKQCHDDHRARFRREDRGMQLL
jgi:hypothetical protein